MLKITKKQVEQMFKEEILPLILEDEKRLGFRDLPLRSESWCNYVDSLNKDRIVTESQANNWAQPSFCN